MNHHQEPHIPPNHVYQQPGHYPQPGGQDFTPQQTVHSSFFTSPPYPTYSYPAQPYVGNKGYGPQMGSQGQFRPPQMPPQATTLPPSFNPRLALIQPFNGYKGYGTQSTYNEQPHGEHMPLNSTPSYGNGYNHQPTQPMTHQLPYLNQPYPPVQQDDFVWGARTYPRKQEMLHRRTPHPLPVVNPYTGQSVDLTSSNNVATGLTDGASWNEEGPTSSGMVRPNSLVMAHCNEVGYCTGPSNMEAPRNMETNQSQSNLMSPLYPPETVPNVYSSSNESGPQSLIPFVPSIGIQPQIEPSPVHPDHRNGFQQLFQSEDGGIPHTTAQISYGPYDGQKVNWDGHGQQLDGQGQQPYSIHLLDQGTQFANQVEVKRKGRGAPLKDQAGRRQTAEMAIALLEGSGGRRQADTLIRCEAGLRALFGQEKEGPLLARLKSKGLPLFNNEQDLLVLLKPENGRKLEAWHRDRLATFKHIKRLSRNATSQMRTNKKKKDSKQTAVMGAAEAEASFKSLYNGTYDYLRRIPGNPFCNGHHCSSCQERWEYITENAGGCRSVPAHEDNQPVAPLTNHRNKNVRAYRARQANETRTSKENIAHYQALLGHLKKFRVHLGLSELAVPPQEQYHENYQLPASSGIVPVNGPRGEDEPQRQQQQACPGCSPFNKLQAVPFLATLPNSLQQKCAQTAYEVMRIEEAPPFLDRVMADEDFLEQYMAIPPAVSNLTIKKETIVCCENCHNSDHERCKRFNEKILLVDSYPGGAVDFSERMKEATGVRYNCRQNICRMCGMGGHTVKKVTLTSEASYVLLKRPPESLPFPKEREQVAGVASAPMFFIEKNESGMRPWRKWRGRWQLLCGEHWMYSQPPPTCVDILYFLFQKV